MAIEGTDGAAPRGLVRRTKALSNTVFSDNVPAGERVAAGAKLAGAGTAAIIGTGAAIDGLARLGAADPGLIHATIGNPLFSSGELIGGMTAGSLLIAGGLLRAMDGPGFRESKGTQEMASSMRRVRSACLMLAGITGAVGATVAGADAIGIFHGAMPAAMGLGQVAGGLAGAGGALSISARAWGGKPRRAAVGE